MKRDWEIIDIDNEKWDNIVEEFTDVDVYYLRAYVKAFKINGDGEPILFHFNNGHTKAMNVMIKRDIADAGYFKGNIEKGKYFDLVTPYGYGGFLMERNDTEKVKAAYLEYCKKNNIISEFVRFHPLLENWKNGTGLYQLICHGRTVAINTLYKERIAEEMVSEHRTRIRKAQKSGMKVYWTRSPEIIRPFMEIYNDTMDKNSASDYYYFSREFYESILEDLKYNSMWFYAALDNRIAAISLFLFKNGKMHYHLSGSRREYQHFAPTNLLIYEAALWANQNGYKKLHLGGGVGAGEDSLYKFKKKFNRGKSCEFWIGKQIFNQDVYDELVALRKKMDSNFNDNQDFFPVYRAIN